MYIKKRFANRVKAEVNTEKSFVEFNQALTPQQIITLFQQNRSREIPTFQNVTYTDQSIPNLDMMDMVEREEYRKHLINKIHNHKNDLSKAEQDYKKEKDFLEYLENSKSESNIVKE